MDWIYIYGILLFIVNYTLPANGRFAKIKYNCVTEGSEERGLCKLLEKCSSAVYQQNNTSNVSAKSCGNYFEKPVVCCTDINKFLEPISFNSHAEMKISDKKCHQYIAEKHKIQLIDNEVKKSMDCNWSGCAPFFDEGIFGRHNVNEDSRKYEFPHKARIGWEQTDGSFLFIYQGIIISERFILTAAHCLHSDDSRFKQTFPTLINVDDSSPIYIEIAEIFPHKDYKPPLKYNDIGLIKLSQSIKFSPQIFPACLYINSTTDKNFTLTGYGHITDTDGRMSPMLQKVKLNIYDDSLCKKTYPKSSSLPEGILESQLCAGNYLGGGDACHGNSGGHIQVEDKLNQGIFNIIGITSFGKGCASRDGGVYTKINHYIGWIEDTVWPNQSLVNI